MRRLRGSAHRMRTSLEAPLFAAGLTLVSRGTQVASRLGMGTRQFLERARALSGAPATVLDRMAALASVRTLGRGELLWHAGDPARSIAVVRSGLIKLVRHANRGRHAICAIFGPPEVLGA